MSDSKSQNIVSEAEQFVREPAGNKSHKKSSFRIRNLLFIILSILFITFAIRFYMKATSQTEPSYELPLIDSTYIIESAVLLEAYVTDHGKLPDGFEDYIASTPGITLTVNIDGSFTYSEDNVVYRSASAIITEEGSL